MCGERPEGLTNGINSLQLPEGEKLSFRGLIDVKGKGLMDIFDIVKATKEPCVSQSSNDHSPSRPEIASSGHQGTERFQLNPI